MSRKTVRNYNTFIDREILEWKCHAFNPKLPMENVFPILTDAIIANGVVDNQESWVQIFFTGGPGSYQFIYRLREPFLANGVGVRFRLRGWKSLRYVGIGYTFSNSFRHVKIVNAIRDEWIEFFVGHKDIAFGLQNNWDCPPSTDVADIRIYLSGAPGDEGAWLDVDSCWWWHEGASPPKWVTEWVADHPESTALQDVIFGYLKKCFRTAESQAKIFMDKGNCPLYGDISLVWPPGSILPSDLQANGTYRFSWHSLHPATVLMMYAREGGGTGPLFAAREMVTNWLDRSYFHADPDKKFAWYDHGTAERLLTMVLMWSIGIKNHFDYRFMWRLRMAIFRHGQLLASELFYASHQPTRYHNHAWFQDLALMATALTLSDLPCSCNWLETALERLTDQLEHLIIRDNEFSVFVENSIGYHQGVQRLVEFAGDLVSLTGKESQIPLVAHELSRFSDFLRYPDNRAPAQGDTFRRGNASGPDVRRVKPYPEPTCAILPQAGYGIVKGNHESVPFMLTMLATSLCRTHKHEDNLSFTLFFDGLEWLIDPSFYSHEYASPIPAYLRSAVAHNALVLPDLPYSIEPGVATLDGHSKDKMFVLRGEHRAYERVRIEREVRGTLDRLELEITDIAITEQDAAGELFMMLHTGEGVQVDLNGHSLLLSHPDSKFRIDVRLPTNHCRIYQGMIEGPIIRGVTGHGFMQHAVVNTVECRVPFNSSLAWHLSAVAEPES